MNQDEIIGKFLGRQHSTIDRQVKRCRYCHKEVNTTNSGICSRKQCKRTRIGTTLDKHGKYLESIINSKEKMIEVEVLR